MKNGLITLFFTVVVFCVGLTSLPVEAKAEKISIVPPPKTAPGFNWNISKATPDPNENKREFFLGHSIKKGAGIKIGPLFKFPDDVGYRNAGLGFAILIPH